MKIAELFRRGRQQDLDIRAECRKSAAEAGAIRAIDDEFHRVVFAVAGEADGGARRGRTEEQHGEQDGKEQRRSGSGGRPPEPAHRLDPSSSPGVGLRRCSRSHAPNYPLSSTSVSGRSLPAAVSVCHLPSAVSYSMTSVRPGVRCSSAARLAAASAASWLRKLSENTP